jgi:hypothetical protein
MLVKEMLKLKAEVEGVRDSGRYHELSHFWLRKSNTPVLAVLMVRKKGQKEPTFVRGLNLEVSLPTGSLCSERNAIGTALSNDPSLVRKDLKMIAVLVLHLHKPTTPPTLSVPSAVQATTLFDEPPGSRRGNNTANAFLQHCDHKCELFLLFCTTVTYSMLHLSCRHTIRRLCHLHWPRSTNHLPQPFPQPPEHHSASCPPHRSQLSRRILDSSSLSISVPEYVRQHR